MSLAAFVHKLSLQRIHFPFCGTVDLFINFLFGRLIPVISPSDTSRTQTVSSLSFTADMDDQPGPPSESLFLPSEIRILIYKLLFAEIRLCRGYPPLQQKKGLTQFSLLLSCKRVYEEAKPFFDTTPIVLDWPQSLHTLSHHLSARVVTGIHDRRDIHSHPLPELQHLIHRCPNVREMRCESSGWETAQTTSVLSSVFVCTTVTRLRLLYS